MPALSRRALLGGLTASPLLLAAPALIGTARAATPLAYAEGGIAIDGTDAVAYRLDGRPVPGKPEIAFDYNGVTWRFDRVETRELFAADPDHYAPAYGGHCAWAASQGYVAPTTPEAWTLWEDRLFLNYGLGVQRRWRRDIPGHVAKGDANWPGLLAG